MCFLCCQLFTDPKKCVPVLFKQTAFLIIFGKFNVLIQTDLYVNHSVKSHVFSCTGGRIRYWMKTSIESRMGLFCFYSCICFQQPNKEHTSWWWSWKWKQNLNAVMLKRKSVVCQCMRDHAFLQQQVVTINIVCKTAWLQTLFAGTWGMFH